MNDQRLEKLFGTTLSLFQKQGFYHTPMSQIASESGISMGSIYNQFNSKEELLNELYKSIKIRFAREVMNKINRESSIKEQIMTLLKNIFNYSFQHKNEIDFVEQYENSPLINEKTQSEIQAILSKTIQLYKKGQETSVLSPLPAESLIALSFGAVSSLAKMKSRQGKIEDTDTLEKYAVSIFKMIEK